MVESVRENLSDFGTAFARGLAAVPNPYGPIVMQVRPSVLARAEDVAICTRSAGAQDFDREVESFDSLDDLDAVFRYPARSAIWARSELRFGAELQAAVGDRYPGAAAAEVSLSMEPELIPFDDVIAVWVDPISIGRARLLDVTRASLARDSRNVKAHARYFKVQQRRDILADIVRFLIEPVPPRLALLARRADVSDETRAFAAAVAERGLDWQFGRFASYLRAGTLEPLRALAAGAPDLSYSVTEPRVEVHQ